MTKSKFSLWVILTTFIIVILSGVNYLIFSTLIFTDNNNKMSFGVVLFIGLLLFTLVWLIFGELRTKIITVVIDSNMISIRNFWGIGRKISFQLSDFDGYKTALLPSKYKTYEYLYLMQDGKKKVKISQFYHHNYSELKIELRKNVKFVGAEHFNYIRELKEIFQ